MYLIGRWLWVGLGHRSHGEPRRASSHPLRRRLGHDDNDRDAALEWLFGVNPLLGDRRPIDLIRMGRAEELMRAIRAERSDAYA